jgi:hypothetical protein
LLARISSMNVMIKDSDEDEQSSSLMT